MLKEVKQGKQIKNNEWENKQMSNIGLIEEWVHVHVNERVSDYMKTNFGFNEIQWVAKESNKDIFLEWE